MHDTDLKIGVQAPVKINTLGDDILRIQVPPGWMGFPFTAFGRRSASLFYHRLSFCKHVRGRSMDTVSTRATQTVAFQASSNEPDDSFDARDCLPPSPGSHATFHLAASVI
jgi:hypothetical protein